MITNHYGLCFCFPPPTSALTHIPVPNTGGYENEKDAPSVGPSPIINIKKEKRETEEETKEILRKLERDTVSPAVQSSLLSCFVLHFSVNLTSPCCCLVSVYRRPLPEE